MREIRDDLKNKINTEKITSLPFDDIICHSECQRKYFTVENNDVIYQRLREEVNIEMLPYLGPCVNFGLGDICLEEGKNIFKFYTIDRASKFGYQEFNNIEDAINHLINFYRENDYVDDSEAMKKIFFETLHLKEKVIKKIK